MTIRDKVYAFTFPLVVMTFSGAITYQLHTSMIVRVLISQQ